MNCREFLRIVVGLCAAVVPAAGCVDLGGTERRRRNALTDRAQESVRRADEKVRVDGVSMPPWSEKSNTFVGALEAALRVTEYPVSYVDLMGYGGVAFRMR